MVEDVNATIDFYRDTLDFEVTATVPESGQFNWASMKNGGVELMFQSRSSITEEYPLFDGRPIGGSLTFYIGVEDVDSLYHQLKDKVKLVLDLHTTFYGAKEFTIQDNNGFVLTFSAQA